MSVRAVTTFLSLLALIALAGAIVTAVVLVGRAREGAFGVMLRRSALALAATIAVIATAGSLYLSEGAHFPPCRLCWYQRIAMYSLAVVLVVAALRRDASVRWYALPLATGGLLISLWHLGVEHLNFGEGACEITNPCNIRWVEHFGFVTIPFMAMCGFVAIIVFTLVADPDALGADEAPLPSVEPAGRAPAMERSGS
ncbi:MAG TPA: disulfide bond formation protein B [Acidimicrobiia bacterium]|jgi:disulfide bond formation protein DsbB